MEIGFKKVLKFVKETHIICELPASVIVGNSTVTPPNIYTHKIEIIASAEIIMTFLKPAKHKMVIY